METTREPYELLFRWIPAGADSQYAGTVQAQVNFAYVIRDGAEIISWAPDPKGPFHVGEPGIDLKEVAPWIDLALADALGSARAELDVVSAKAAALETELASIARVEDAEKV